MTRLTELLHSLTTVIIRYHDAHSSKKLINEANSALLIKKSREYSPTILARDEFANTLTGYIEACTDKNYPIRHDFLNYLLNQIIFLKGMQDCKQPLAAPNMEQYKEQIQQMLQDFMQLLKTTKGLQHEVIYSPNKNKKNLNGLINNAYLGNKFCYSGDLLLEGLKWLNLSETSTVEEIKDFTEELCTEHQNLLLVPDLQQKLKAEQESTATLHNDLETARNELAGLTQQKQTNETELAQLRDQLRALEAAQSRIVELQDALAQQKKAKEIELAQMRTQISTLETKNKSAAQPPVPNTQTPKPAATPHRFFPLLSSILPRNNTDNLDPESYLMDFHLL